MVSLQDILGGARPGGPAGPSGPGGMPPVPAQGAGSGPDGGMPEAQNEQDVLKRLVLLMLQIPEIRSAIEAAMGQHGGPGMPPPGARPPGMPPGPPSPGGPPAPGGFAARLQSLQNR